MIYSHGLRDKGNGADRQAALEAKRAFNVHRTEDHRLVTQERTRAATEPFAEPIDYDQQVHMAGAEVLETYDHHTQLEHDFTTLAYLEAGHHRISVDDAEAALGMMAVHLENRKN